jgi:preprotein translocase subunit SecG
MSKFLDRFSMTITTLFVVLASILVVAYAYGAESTTQRDAPTTRFYTPDGKSAGTASTHGNTTKFYAPDGKLVGSATNNRGR